MILYIVQMLIICLLLCYILDIVIFIKKANLVIFLWYVFAILAVAFINFYIYFRFFHKSNIPKFVKAFVVVLLVNLAFCDLCLHWRFRRLFNVSLYDIFNPTIYLIICFCITLCGISLLIDFPYLLISKFSLKRFYNSKLMHPLFKTFLIAVALSITVWGVEQGGQLPQVKSVQLSASKISSPISMTLVTDLHITRLSDLERINTIVDLINEQNSDIIVLGGDIFDDYKDLIYKQVQPLKRLSAKYGVFYVTGNHEYYLDVSIADDLAKELNFIQLNNSGLSIREDLFLSGIPDRHMSKLEGHPIKPKKALADATDQQYKILISHEPYVYDEANLILSGHTHCGKIFPSHFTAFVLTKYRMLGGLYGNQDSYRYVSCGAGEWGAQIREFSPYDISVIQLKPIEN